MPNTQDIMATAQSFLPKLSGIGSGFVSVIAIVIIFCVIAIVFSIILFMVIQNKRYKYRIIIFENINGIWVDTSNDKAMELRFGDMGTSILYFKKMRRYEPFPQHFAGKYKVYYRKRGGVLENWEHRDTTDKADDNFMQMIKAMLFHHTAINRGLEKRYNQMTWLKEYAPIIVSVVFIILIGVFTWLLFDKWIELAKTTNTGVETAGKVMDKADSILGKLDNIKSGGSGILPAKLFLSLIT